MFGFVLVLGIVVDDAIIVGENIYRHQEEHADGMRGSIEGAYEIAKPVTFAVLTTVAAFSPLLFVPGMMGKIFRVIPLVGSVSILPAHPTSLMKLPRFRGHLCSWKGGASTMPKTRPPYAAEFRQQMVDLVRAG